MKSYQEHLHKFEELSSSNDEAKRECYIEGDLIVAEHQLKGRGQRGHTWLSDRGMNLTATLRLEPHFLRASEQFLISELVALALCDMLQVYGIRAEIKWTNDIYVGGKKIAGILIEHTLSGENLKSTIVGVGLNINQRVFSPELPNPTSMANILGRELSREDVVESLWRCLMARYVQLRDGKVSMIEGDYLKRIYRLNQKQRFRLPSGEEFDGVIRGVEHRGDLVVEHPDHKICKYMFREVEFVIEKSDNQQK